ncbi:MAG: FtsX-like permease family protein, partial [Burkholderiales bacterium]|nr:FtsX-like permease family protein [Burkholderiales bacterium]
QKDEIYARLKKMNGDKDLPIYPTARGRLVEINGKPAKVTDYESESARRLMDREFNLSTMRTAPIDNSIVEGKWFAPDSAQAGGEISLEKSLANTLRLKLGDTIKFDIAGQMVEGKVTSIRKLDWNSMKVNFYAILSPRAMQDAPFTWVTAFHLPEGDKRFTHQLTSDFPNLTIIDTSAMIKQARDIIDQITTAVEFLFSFTLAAGVMVLYAALLGSQEERARESGLLRALGATRRQLSRAQAIEFILVGGVAGVLAASGAAAIGFALAKFIFEFEWVFNPQIWLIGMVSGAACALLGGWLGLRNVLNQPPLATLREAA